MAQDWSGWEDKKKPWDPTRPLHRIESPSFQKYPDRATGRGYERGCRVRTEIPFSGPLEAILSLIRDPRLLIRTAPSWVDVTDSGELEEVEGILVRSFQTWTDFPLFQWHQWYDWNFHLEPVTGFANLAGAHNHSADDLPGGFRPVVRGLAGEHLDSVIECEWDCGVMGARQAALGPMFAAHRSPSRAEAEDWCWPMTGQMVWIRGRWIYDCGHPTNEIKRGPNQGLVRSELHPCHAVATARWEAVNFAENEDRFVPAIQFMFFQTRLGGYSNLEGPEGGPYKFIVDLPPLGIPAEPEHSIGHTPGHRLNTLALRPRLLQKKTSSPFTQPRQYHVVEGSGVVAKPVVAAALEPEVKLVDPFDPEKPQAEVTISLDDVGTADACGVILSLGWFDPDGTQAQRVKKVRVSDLRVEVSDDHDPGRGSGEWVLKLGVNGRWAMRFIEGVDSGDTIRFDGVSFEFYLSDHEWNQLVVSCHGEELDDVHDVFQDRSNNARLLRFEGSTTPYDYENHVLRRGDLDRENDDGELSPPDRTFKRELVSRMQGMFSLGEINESDPLGRIDPFHGENYNPFQVAPIADRGPQPFHLVARPTEEVGDSAELAERPSQVDYTLRYTVEVTST